MDNPEYHPQEEYVRFTLSTLPGAEYDPIALLGALGESVRLIKSHHLDSLSCDLLVCEAPLADYERIFGSIVISGPRSQDLAPGAYRQPDWLELQAPKVPSGLENAIQYVGLDRIVHATNQHPQETPPQRTAF